MTRWTNRRWLAGLATMIALTSGLSSLTWGQSQGDRTQSTLLVPPAQELLRIEVDTPDQVRVNNEFEYSIRVTNQSDSVVLHDIRIAQKTQDGFEIESAQIQKKEQHQESDQSAEPSKQGNDQQVKSGESKSQNKKQGKDGSREKGQDESAGRNAWTISQLEPGETRTIRVTASSENEGDQQMCLMVKSFTPALCVTTTFTKPELQVAVDLPEKANVCEPFEIEYYIKNTGTGAVETLTVQSDLPEGLTLEDGSRKVNFDVDGLEPDQVRKFAATVMAKEPGEYSTRGIVTAPGGLTARSKKWSVDVRAAELAVAIDGPNRVHIDREATYTVRVSNNGDATARDASLMLRFPQSVGLVSTGQVQKSDETVASSDSQGGNGAQTRTAAYRGDGSSQENGREQEGDGQTASESSGDQASEPADEQWDLGDLGPGETREVQVTLRPDEARKMQIEAVARHMCGGEEKSEPVDTIAGTSTEVIAVPALAIGVIDMQDPVDVDSNVTYRIVLENEGTAAAKQLEVRVEVPEQYEYVDGNGTTDVNAEEGTLTFAPVESLSAGDKATWEVRFQAKDTGQVRLPVHVTSNGSTQPIRAEEPTRLIRN